MQDGENKCKINEKHKTMGFKNQSTTQMLTKTFNKHSMQVNKM